jgi:hypothetical protein
MYTKFNLLFILTITLVGFAVCQDAGVGFEGESMGAASTEQNDQKGSI